MKKILMLMFSMVLIIGSVSAWDWDNWIGYEDEDMTVIFENAFGLGSKLGKAKLTSHISITEVKNVIRGKDRVPMYYDFYNWKKQYNKGLGEVEFTDMTTGKKINKEYKFVYAVYEDYNKPIYDTNCEEKIINYPNASFSTVEVCNEEIIDYQLTKRLARWEELTNKDIPKGEIRIGIMVDVESGEHIDAVWTIAGKKV